MTSRSEPFSNSRRRWKQTISFAPFRTPALKLELANVETTAPRNYFGNPTGAGGVVPPPNANVSTAISRVSLTCRRDMEGSFLMQV